MIINKIVKSCAFKKNFFNKKSRNMPPKKGVLVGFTDFLIKVAISQFSQTPTNTAPELKVPDSV
jgi:hypothetical protein